MYQSARVNFVNGRTNLHLGHQRFESNQEFTRAPMSGGLLHQLPCHAGEQRVEFG